MRRNFRALHSLFLALRDFNHNPQSIELLPHFLTRNHFMSALNPRYSRPPHSNNSISRISIYASYTTSIHGQEEPQSEADDEELTAPEIEHYPVCSRDLETISDILQTLGAQEKSKKLEECRVTPTPGLVANVLSSIRNDWETAFTFFLWAGKQSAYEHSLREYHSMIAILGKFRKFDTAWSLINNDMKNANLVTPQTILIMIRRYAAAHDVARAINAFYALRRFKFEVRIEEFQGLLSALCRYKNVKDAEHLLFCNKTVFPLNTKSFNIILNGWCNVIGNLREGKRIWREMGVRGINHDVYSYSSIISCHSKAKNMNVVLSLYEKMKGVGIKPDRKVYNAVIHALAKGRLVKEALRLMKTMEEEGFTPDGITYNSLILPLCKLRMLDEAKQVFDEMTEKGIHPTVRTYHAFLRVLRTGEEVFDLLERMYSTGCQPSHDTYVMLIRKFCRWNQIDNMFKLWNEMRKNGLDHDQSSYIVLIHGLFLNGRLEEAHKYYLEMKEKQMLSDPKIDSMIQAWLVAKTDADGHVIMSKEDQSIGSKLEEKAKEKDFRRQPEVRSVTRERGFSFWDN